MNNDLSTYKRAISFFPREVTEEEHSILPKLAFFIATQDQFSIDIKKALSLISSAAEDLIIEILNKCMDLLDTDSDLIPQAKHVYLRVVPKNNRKIGYCIFYRPS